MQYVHFKTDCTSINSRLFIFFLTNVCTQCTCFLVLSFCYGYPENQGFVMFSRNASVDCVLQKLEKEMAKTAHTLKWARIKANDDTMEARSAEKKCRDLEHANVRMAAAIEKTKKSNNQLSSHLKTTQKTLKKLKGSFF